MKMNVQSAHHSATRDVVLIGSPHRHHPRSPQVAHLPPQLGQVPRVRLLFLVVTVRTERALATQAAACARAIRARIFQTYRDAVLGRRWVESKDEAEGVFAIEIETVETFLTDETEGSVEGKSCSVVMFGLKNDLNKVDNEISAVEREGIKGKSTTKRTSSTPLDFMASMEWRTRALATHVRPQRKKRAHVQVTARRRDNNATTTRPMRVQLNPTSDPGWSSIRWP